MSQVARARLDLWVVKFSYWPAIFFFQVGLRTERLTLNQTNLRLQKLEQRLTLAEMNTSIYYVIYSGTCQSIIKKRHDRAFTLRTSTKT